MDNEENISASPDTPAPKENTPKVEAEEVQVRKFSSFDEGLVNGVLRMETHPFMDFIQHLEETHLTQQQIAINQVRTAQKKEEYHAVKAELLSWKQKLNEFTEADRVQQIIIRHLEAERDRFMQLIGHCREKADTCVMEFPIFSALLFFLAALVFIVADILFTKNIVGLIFDFPEIEAWIVSIGLSFITFVIKPVIDRVIEKPYRNNTRQKLVHITYLIIAIFALILLFVLGHLRLLGVAQISLDAASLVSAIVQTTSAFLLFVLSSMLFALAGAICLSISLPNLTSAERKIRYRILIRWYNRLRLHLLRKIEQAYAVRKDLQIGIEQAAFHLSQLRPMDMLEEEWKRLVDEGDVLLERLTQEEIKKEQALYLEGVERGKKLQLNGELYLSPYQVLGRIFRNSVRYRSTNTGRGTTRSENREKADSSTGHLHKEIRKMIDFTFTRNQNGF